MTESALLRQELVCFQIIFGHSAAIMIDWERDRCDHCGVHHGNAWFGFMDAHQ